MKKSSSIARSLQDSIQKNEQYWLENITKLKTKRFNEIRGMKISDIQYIASDQQLVRIWLKTGLYMNREDLIEKQIKELPPQYIVQKELENSLVSIIIVKVSMIKQRTLLRI